ncbi:phosphatidylserine decarboxylase [Paraburkholderia lycopersici]|uniref:Phosphatidylserine decarboxylase n=2 Tax=Paraburkholderia lycopersici TaxID=416944 RepID=A0A1G6TEX6_9BURK|nr:phosphatidylserine decarboxylase family protein [Paraburkholderia lycopersici]SDD27414.1 phosphatidylserine decarboxylase [Paraburkholderia lycopersici]
MDAATKSTRAGGSLVLAKRRLGNWMPAKEELAVKFRKRIAQAARERAKRTPMANVVRELADLVQGDTVLRMNLTRAINEAHDVGFELGYGSIDELMAIIDYLVTYAPPFNASVPIATPLNLVLDWPMCMPSGYAVFRDPAFNAQLRRVLSCWCGFLDGPHSRAYLTADEPHGWLSETAREKMGLDQFVCDASQPYWGFESWNAFFTRRLRDGARPVDAPNDASVIVNACEASPYDVSENCQLHDRFWIKSQPYSLREILAGSDMTTVRRLIGGSVYQGYLSAFNYHRWHAPVAGRVREAYNIDGTYYSEIEAEGTDARGLNDSQGYTTAVAARAVIVIECDNEALGVVACVFVGMAEVSSCRIVALPGQRVKKGDEIGFFQYGGSTYCLIFQPGVIRAFEPQPPYRDDVPPLKVNSRLAIANAAQ